MPLILPQYPLVYAEIQLSPLSLLFSDSDSDGDIKQVTILDPGSHSRLACVSMQGGPAKGIVDIYGSIHNHNWRENHCPMVSSARLHK